MFPLFPVIEVKNRRGPTGLRIISLTKSATKIGKVPDAYLQASFTEQPENSELVNNLHAAEVELTEEDGHA